MTKICPHIKFDKNRPTPTDYINCTFDRYHSKNLLFQRNDGSTISVLGPLNFLYTSTLKQLLQRSQK